MPFILILAVLSTLSLISYYFKSSALLNSFFSYLTNKQSQVRVSGILSVPFVVLSSVPQGSVLGPLISTYLWMKCDVINYSRYLLFADDIKIFSVIKSPNHCNRLQSDTDSVQGWCTANFMKLNIIKTSYFLLKKN
jgi:hypothetical protein